MYLNMNWVTTELAVSLILNSPTFLLIEQGGFSPVIGHQKRYCSRAPREGARLQGRRILRLFRRI